MAPGGLFKLGTHNDMTSPIARRYVANLAAILLVGGALATGYVFCWPDFAPNAIEAATPITLVLLALLVYNTQASLRTNPQRLLSALNHTASPLLATDLRGHILAINASAERVFAHPADALKGQPISHLIGVTLWRQLESGTDDSQLTFEHTGPKGRTQHFTCAVEHIKNIWGQPVAYIVQLNSTVYKQIAKQQANNAAVQLRRIVGNTSDLVVFTDAKLSITYANNNILSAFEGDPLGKPSYYLIAAADRRRFMKTLEQFTQKERNEAALQKLHLADSEKTEVAARFVRLREPEKTGFALIFSLAESQLQALAENRTSQARFSQVFHGTPDAILLLRASDTMVVDFNDGFTRLLGYRREEAIGELELDLGFWANAVERDAIIEQIRRDREVLGHETTLRKSDGSVVHVEISLRYVEIDNELCVLCVGRDITKRISAEAALVESEEKFERMFSQSPDCIVILRYADGTITDVNDTMLERSEYTREEILGQSFYEEDRFIKAGDLKKASKDLLGGNSLANWAVTVYTRSGEEVPMLLSATVMELSGEQHVMVIAKDMSQQRSTEEQLRSSEERFRGIFLNAPFGIMLVDMQGQVFQANRTAAELLAYEEQELKGIHISRLVPSEDRVNLKEALASMSAESKLADRSERRMICHDGLEIWTNFHVVLQPNNSGEGEYYIVQIADITNIKRSQQRMERMAFYDTLTDLANRRLFHERLEHAIAQCVRNDRSSALLYLDLDNFKRVNDTLGHQVGDQLLREVASRLKQCVRDEDTVGRTGGDEFTILLTEIGTPTDAGVVAQKILNHLREPIQISGYPLVVTTSIGITVLPSDAVDPNVLMRNADLAMYKAKERGRNNYQFYSEDLNTTAVDRLRTEYEIRHALENDEFELFYQPKIALRDQRIVGVESLIRWNHPERGLIGPDEFIGVAEDTGSIIDIGSWVIEEACRACQVLCSQQSQPIQVAINISPRQFRDPNLITTMRRSLREAKLDPKNIEIEITETMLMQDVEAAQITVERLSELGVSLAIDDFGTGYSSLNYLKRFPINTVKVDRSFVTDLPSNADDMAITRAVIAMAHQLKMEVVAEGVETREQLEFLAHQKCEYAQGWLFSKALPLNEVVSLLRNNLGVIHL